MSLAHGSDVSFWQDDPDTIRVIDFEQMAKGLDFTIIRAGQNLWKDREFDTSWKNAKAAGIPRGSYWFYDSRVDPKRQAEKYIETLNGDLGELPLVADFEDRYGGEWGSVLDLYDFIEHLKKLAPGKDIILYTGYYYWREKTRFTPKASVDYFAQYPLWLAWYNSPIEDVKVPAPWTEWTIWQYTDNGDGTKYGVESLNIDLNYFNGSVQEFREKFGLDEKSDDPHSPPDNISSKIVQTLQVRIYGNT